MEKEIIDILRMYLQCNSIYSKDTKNKLRGKLLGLMVKHDSKETICLTKK